MQEQFILTPIVTSKQTVRQDRSEMGLQAIVSASAIRTLHNQFKSPYNTVDEGSVERHSSRSPVQSKLSRPMVYRVMFSL
jgi:hypothetical protein